MTGKKLGNASDGLKKALSTCCATNLSGKIVGSEKFIHELCNDTVKDLKSWKWTDERGHSVEERVSCKRIINKALLNVGIIDPKFNKYIESNSRPSRL